MTLDKTDWAIIEMLSQENQSNKAIADQLNLTEGAIRQRLKKLKESGMLKIRAMRNPEIIPNQQLAIIMANVSEFSQLEEKAKEISKLPSVLSVSLLAGQYDLMIEILVDSNRGLMTFITEVLSKVDGISNSETMVTLKSYNKFI